MAQRLFEATTPITTIDDTLRLALGKAGQEYDNIEWGSFKALFYESWKTDVIGIKYRKTLFNWVEVLVLGPNVRPGVTFFTLPVGYRPIIDTYLAIPGRDDASGNPIEAYSKIVTTGILSFDSTGSADITGDFIVRYPLD